MQHMDSLIQPVMINLILLQGEEVQRCEESFWKLWS